MKRPLVLSFVLLIVLSYLSACGTSGSNNSFSITYNGNSFIGEYSGDLTESVPNGTGSFSSNDGNFSYSGGWENGELHGSGILETNCYAIAFRDGIIRVGTYSGSVVDGIASGSGSFTATNDDGISYTYTGEFKNGLFDGIGKLVFDDPTLAIQDGHFSEGEFAPTPLEFFTAYGSSTTFSYSITTGAERFIEENPAFFTDHIPSVNPQYFSYPSCKECYDNPELYASRLYKITNSEVLDIAGYHYWNADHTCLFLYGDALYTYFIIIYGDYPGISVGDIVDMVALPISSCSDSIGRRYIVFAGVSIISKEENISSAEDEKQETDNTLPLSIEQVNAIQTARNYLHVSAFSREGLIAQLEYEEYSREVAEFAVDFDDTDWDAQALKAARNYLEFSAFSYSGLFNQLKYEKYTDEQAQYSVDNCGADWNEQAVKCAANYLRYSSFSRDSLINQLLYEGFTRDQAEYGVSQNGY